MKNSENEKTIQLEIFKEEKKPFLTMSRDEKMGFLRSQDSTNDVLFSLYMNNDPEIATLFAKTFVDELKDVTITRVQAQKGYFSIGSKDIRLDAQAETEEGTVIDFEMQRKKEAHFEKRLRYYSTAFTLNYVEKGGEYKNIPKHVQIIFTFKDKMKKNKPVYIVKWKDEDGDVGDNSETRAYVNLSYEGEDAKGRLINDLKQFDYNKIESPELKKKVRFYKEEGIDMFIDAYSDQILYEREQAKKEGIEIGKKEGVEIGKKEGVEIGKKEGVEIGKEETLKANILALKKNLGISSIQISQALAIPIEKVDKVLRENN